MKKLLLLCLWSCFTGPSLLQGQGFLVEKVEKGLLQDLQSGGKQECLIIFESAPGVYTQAFSRTGKIEKGRFVYNALKDWSTRTQKPAVEVLGLQHAYFVSFSVVNAIYTVADLSTISALASLPDVVSIQPNPSSPLDEPVEKMLVSSRDSHLMNWGISMIQADAVWDMGIRGDGAVVGGQDTGYEWDHPILKHKYRGFEEGSGVVDHNYHWHDGIHEISPLAFDSLNPCGLSLDVPCDDHSHGTHTMGTMVGSADDEYYGIAPDAKWIGCRNMERGNGSLASYLECFEWFLAPTDLDSENPNPDLAPHVINNSWYCSEAEGCNIDNFHLMEAAVNNLKAAGIVVVISAGNSGSQGCSSVDQPPAIFENSFSVGATGASDRLARFSSRGPVMVDSSGRLKPNVVAPGNGILSSVLNGQFAVYGGTSMAGPHVAGAVALMIAANPGIAGDVEAIETILEQTAEPKTDSVVCGGLSSLNVPNHLYGYGRINALAAVQAALNYVGVKNTSYGNIEISVFPNPFTDAVFFDVRSMKGAGVLELFDLSGKLIFSQDFQASHTRYLEIHPPLNSGKILFYRIRTADLVTSGKLINR